MGLTKQPLEQTEGRLIMTSVEHRHVPIPKSQWFTDFLSMLPTIRKHAAMAFRYLNSEAREEAINDAIANAMVIYVRLVQLKKVDLVLSHGLGPLRRDLSQEANGSCHVEAQFHVLRFHLLPRQES